jgi:Cache 3/Cache 2 fusion domain
LARQRADQVQIEIIAKISTKKELAALGVIGTSPAHMCRMLRNADYQTITEATGRSVANGINLMNTLKLVFVAAGLLVAAPAFAQGTAGGTPNTGPQGTGNFVAGKAEGNGNFVAGTQANPRVRGSMELLKSTTAKLGAPKVNDMEAVGGKDAPALYFGTRKMNNNFDVVDAIGKEDGGGMTATLFVKGGDEYIRVATSVPKPDGSGRAIGTVLAGPALEAIKQGKAYYGDVPILGTPYTGAYEPIKDSSGSTVGIYYVGYKK